jgi:hypothetical protein
MAVQISWLVKGRVIYAAGTLDRDEIIERNRLSYALIEAEGQPPMVHILIDHSNRYTAEDLQHQIRSLSHYVKLDSDDQNEQLIKHPLLGWILSIANPSQSLKMAGAVRSQQYNYRWHSVDTLEDALDFLQERDGTLPDLRALLDEL